MRQHFPSFYQTYDGILADLKRREHATRMENVELRRGRSRNEKRVALANMAMFGVKELNDVGR